VPEVHFVDEENTKLKQSESEEEDKAKPSGKCMVCGRKLQAPESLRRMIGPVCAQKIPSAKDVPITCYGDIHPITGQRVIRPLELGNVRHYLRVMFGVYEPVRFVRHEPSCRKAACSHPEAGTENVELRRFKMSQPGFMSVEGAAGRCPRCGTIHYWREGGE